MKYEQNFRDRIGKMMVIACILISWVGFNQQISIFSPVTDAGQESPIYDDKVPLPSQSEYSMHVIYGDDWLETTPLVSGGNGMPETPYIIENLTMDLAVSRKDCGLFVVAVTKHLLIRNCIVLNQSTISENDVGGIHVFLSDNVRIEKCVFMNMTNFGIKAEYCTNITISGNLFKDCHYCAVFFDQASGLASGIHISDNVVLGGGSLTMFFLSSITNSSFVRNYMDGGARYGIELVWNADNNLLEGNYIRNMGSAAIQDDVNNDNTYFNNTLVNNSLGLYIEYHDKAYFNAFINNTAQINSDTFATPFYLHNGTHGNYYSDYTTRYPAATNDGVTWNTPYTVPYGSDPHPLVNAPGTFSPSSHVSFIQNSSVVIEGEDIAFSFAGHLFHPGNANFTWDFGDGNSSTEMNPVHGYAIAGTYIPTLNVQDGSGVNFSTSALNPITVEVDTVPTVEFDPASISGYEGMQLQLNFTGTTGNWPATFEWVFGDGTANSTYRDPLHTYQSNGTYTANLTVRDRNGDTGTGSLTVTVQNVVPVADFDFNGDYLFINESMRFFFNGTLGNDPGTYSWDFGDGSSLETGRYLDKTYSQAGYFTVTMNVTDVDGDFATIQKSVYVNDNRSFVVDFLPSSDRIEPGECITFNFTGHALLPAVFEWDFGDGNVYSERDPVHCFTEAGTYCVTLVVTNAKGDSMNDGYCIVVAEDTPPGIAGYPLSVIYLSLAVVASLIALHSKKRLFSSK